LFGPNLDDIGQSIARFIQARFPNYSPKRIVDLGCTVGHNTGAWKDCFPDAIVTGVDVAAPCLRYAATRARSQRRAVHFEQMNAERLTCADASVDLVFSSMFLHEVPRAGIARIFREAWRVLRPGGLMLHMELPPTHALSPFDAFYLDWDGYYNNEPYYRQYRALVPRALTTSAGFKARDFMEFVVPSLTGLGEARWREAVAQGCALASDKTGRLTSGVQWYCFGAFKT
jgi:ubiquinone/menaquinone biosynthesis C-methylase UbiE